MRAASPTERAVQLDALARQLADLRAKGVHRAAAAETADVDLCVAAVVRASPTDLQAHHYDAVLGRVVAEMGDGDAADLAAILFGIAPHVRGLHPIQLRKRAAEVAYERQPDTATVDAFRKTREPRILASLAVALARTADSAAEPSPTPPEPAAGATRGAELRIGGPAWRARTLPVLTVTSPRPGRIYELSWPQFGAGIDRLRDQLRNYGSSLDVDLAIGVNEGGLLMATLLASSAFDRCSIAYVRTVRRGHEVVVDADNTALGHRLASATTVLLCDFEVKTAPVLDTVVRYLTSQGLRPATPTYVATMGALATLGTTLPDQAVYDVAKMPCATALAATPLADVFVGYLMANPGIDPPLGLR